MVCLLKNFKLNYKSTIVYSFVRELQIFPDRRNSPLLISGDTSSSNQGGFKSIILIKEYVQGVNNTVKLIRYFWNGTYGRFVLLNYAAFRTLFKIYG